MEPDTWTIGRAHCSLVLRDRCVLELHLVARLERRLAQVGTACAAEGVAKIAFAARRLHLACLERLLAVCTVYELLAATRTIFAGFSGHYSIVFAAERLAGFSLNLIVRHQRVLINHLGCLSQVSPGVLARLFCLFRSNRCSAKLNGRLESDPVFSSTAVLDLSKA